MRIATLIATVVLGAGVLSAQSLGDAARQERMRRAGLEKHSRVLTNEDFSREQILPQDSKENAALPAASASQPAAPLEPTAQAVNRPAVPVGQTTRWEAPEISLGEYARTVRAERARREARLNPDPVAEARSEPPAPQERLRGVDSGVPAWTAAEQPDFSLGEYARMQRALHHKDVPVQLTLKAKAAPAVATPAPKPTPSLSARQERKSLPARPRATPVAPSADGMLVQTGDSLWKLSRAHLGEGRLWTAVWAANPQLRNPNMIHPGQSLNRPTEIQLAAARRAFSSGRMVVARLARAPRTASRSARLRSVGLQPAGTHRGSAGRLPVFAAERDGWPVSESYNRRINRLHVDNRLVAFDSPSRGGLR